MSATPDREGRPHVRCARAFGSGGCGEDLLPFTLGEASPDPVRLVYLQRVPAAFQQSRAPRADRLRLRLAPRARRAAFALRVEEIGTGHATACRVKLPVPHIRVGPRKAPGVCHHVPLCDLGRPDPHATDEGGGRNDRGIAPRPGPPCFHRIRGGAEVAVFSTIDRHPIMIKACRGTRPVRRGRQPDPWPSAPTGCGQRAMHWHRFVLGKTRERDV